MAYWEETFLFFCRCIFHYNWKILVGVRQQRFLHFSILYFLAVIRLKITGCRPVMRTLQRVLVLYRPIKVVTFIQFLLLNTLQYQPPTNR